ncbi:FAD:protein FMN transferase [Motiliproteus coralliicola]|uniref:FAD:protein FMN transferase n=2 Tax=Motiliproteus coralliicola TaxID=2283196 RepID=A0A369WWD0_9GAMM|nr:FAD:protein FMN transferase [Motiliproteus coralliicola]
MMFHIRYRIAALLALAAVLLTGCTDGDPRVAVHALSGQTMGTSYHIKVVASEELDKANLQQRIQAVLDRIEARMSTYREDSELSRFNRLQGQDWFDVSDETAAVVSLAQTISDQTQGAFDATVGPLVNLWGFGPDPRIHNAPDSALIDERMQQIGYQAVQVRQQPPSLSKQQSRSLDLSAIAKGYAVDQLAELLANEFDGFMVEVGGELRLHGNKPGDKPWRIAIERPDVGSRKLQQVIEVGDNAIATSGDYRNYFEQDGVRFSHTIDPKTGRPIRHRLASVTVVDPSCARADAFATAMMVLGDEKGLALATELGLNVFFIVKSDEGFVEKHTPGFERFIKSPN